MFRPVKIRQYLAFMKSEGHAAVDVLKGSGIDAEMLAESSCLVDINQSKAIVANMIALSGDQGIGLRVGFQTELVDLGLVGYLMMSAQSAREATQYWINYSNALIGMLIEMRLEERAPDDWSLLITESIPLGFIYNFCVEEQLVMVYKMGGELALVSPMMKQLELSYPAPSHQALYLQYFNGPIRFNARCTRITFASPRLDQPLRGNDREFNDLCARQCDLLLRQIGAHSPMVSRIKNILMRSRGRIPSIDETAKELSTSPRSLRRRLQDEGMSYQQLVNDFRLAMAREYLQSVSATTKEVAYLLGFKDTNSFRRAFKLWTGKTVQEYRFAATNGKYRSLA